MKSKYNQECFRNLGTDIFYWKEWIITGWRQFGIHHKNGNAHQLCAVSTDTHSLVRIYPSSASNLNWQYLTGSRYKDIYGQELLSRSKLWILYIYIVMADFFLLYNTAVLFHSKSRLRSRSTVILDLFRL